MNRGQLIKELQQIAPVYNVGQSYKHKGSPYIVLKAMTDSRSGNNSYGGFQTYNIMCYVPDTSTAQLDEIITAVKNKVFELQKYGIEYTGDLGEDFHDSDINMYMRYVGIRVPHQSNM